MRRRQQQATVEPLRERGALSSSLSAQSLYSYDEKRPDWVERPDNDNAAAQLARSLSRFSPVLADWSNALHDQHQEESMAEGQRLFAENRRDWNDFVQTNPEAAGFNPYLERGYKSAELETKGLEFKQHMRDFYTNSGLQNETDQAKVGEAIQAEAQNALSRMLNPEDYNKVDVAKVFLPQTRQAETELSGRYAQDRAQETLKLGAEKFSTLVGAEIEQALMNTPDIKHPEVFDSTMSAVAERIQVHALEMEVNGLPRSLRNDSIVEAVFNTAEAVGGEDGIKLATQVLNKIPTGTGFLGGRTDVAAKLAHFKKSVRDEQWQKYQRGRQVEADRREDMARQAVVSTFGFLTQQPSGAPLPTLEELIQATGASPEAAGTILTMRNTFEAGRTLNVVMDQQTSTEYNQYLLQARMGELDPRHVPAMTGRFGQQYAAQLMKEASAYYGQDADTLGKMLRNTNFSEANNILNAQMAVSGAFTNLDTHVQLARRLEAEQVLKQEVTRKARLLEEEGKKISPLALEDMARDLAVELGKSDRFRSPEITDDIRTPKDLTSVNQQLNAQMAQAGKPAPYLSEESSRYWKENKKAIMTAEEVSALMDEFLRDPQAATKAVVNKHNLPAEQLAYILDNQLALNGLSWDSFVERHAQSKEEALRQQKRKDFSMRRFFK